MPEVRQAGEHVVADRVLLHRGVHAEHDRQDHREDVPQNSSCSVGQSARPIIADTGSCVRLLVPMSPRTKLGEPVPPLHDDRVVEAEQLPLLRDDQRRVLAGCRNFASGSTDARTSQNVMNDATSSTGIEPSTRRTRYLSTRPPHPLRRAHRDRPRAIASNATA